MNKFIALFSFAFFALFFFSSCKETVEYTDRFGRLSTKMEMRRGVPHGKTTLYYNDGYNVLQESYYKKGVLDGYSVRWYYHGGKEYEEFYVNGNLHGKKSTWDKSGLLVVEDHYDNGTLHGTCKKWYDNGQIQIDSRYNNGMPDSTWHYFDYYGLEVGYANFDNGNGTHVAISPDNTIKVTTYSDGVPSVDSIVPFTLDKYNLIKKIVGN